MSEERGGRELEAELAEGLERGTTVFIGSWDSPSGILTSAPGMSDEEQSIRTMAVVDDEWFERMRRMCDLHVADGMMSPAEAAAHFRRRAVLCRDALAEVIKRDAAREAWGLITSLRPGECCGCGVGVPCRCGAAAGRPTLPERLAALDRKLAELPVPDGVEPPSPCVMDMRVRVRFGEMTPEEAAARCAKFGETVPAADFERFVQDRERERQERADGHSMSK
jgi:hypothetical protein